MNYTNLETAIQNYAQNSDTTFVSQINDFIRGAEDKIFEAIKGPLFWNGDSSGSFIDSTSTYNLASGAIDILDIYCHGNDASTDGKTLDRKDHSFIREAYPVNTGSTLSGMPRYYALTSVQLSSGEPQLSFYIAPRPATGITYTYTISYYGKATTDSITSGNTPGTSSTDETWLSVAYPDLLLYGALTNAYVFMKGDPNDISRYRDEFEKGILLLKNMTEQRQDEDVTSSLEGSSGV
jgi:hypothetical protein|tara:strand:+ start:465 stop:1175 length:711 start_codon:yes stop_codon:yes gene_type:complete